MDTTIRVTHNVDAQQFDITVDGEHAGSSLYRDTERAGKPQRIIYHTVIDDAFTGQGLASTLTREVIRQSVDDGYRIVPLCPYVAKWLTRHDDFAAHIDPVSSTHLALLS